MEVKNEAPNRFARSGFHPYSSSGNVWQSLNGISSVIAKQLNSCATAVHAFLKSASPGSETGYPKSCSTVVVLPLSASGPPGSTCLRTARHLFRCWTVDLQPQCTAVQSFGRIRVNSFTTKGEATYFSRTTCTHCHFDCLSRG